MRIIEKRDFTDKDLQEVFALSEAADVVRIEHFQKAFFDRVQTDPVTHGYPFPWIDTHDKVRLRTGEVSVWCGINGHKKSTVASFVLTHLAQHVKVGLASFEMKMSDTAYMMCKQAAAADEPPMKFAQEFYDWVGERVYWYRALGGVEPLEVLGCIIAMADQGVKVVLVDNLQFCGVTDDIERERLFMNQLLGIAEAKDVHICLVHHVRKPQSGGDEYIPTRFDVRGGGTIVDQAHLLFIIWHNKRRQKVKQFQVMGEKLTEKEQLIMAEPDLKLIVAKQRNGPYEGHINLWEGKGLTFKKAESHRSMHIEFPRS